MQQPPRVSVAPTSRHSEQHMSLASNYIGTATAGNLRPLNVHTPSFPQLSVTGSSVNPLTGSNNPVVGFHQPPPVSPVIAIPATPILASSAPSQQLPVTFTQPHQFQPIGSSVVGRSASSLASDRRIQTQSPLGSSTSSHVHFGQAQVITPTVANPPALTATGTMYMPTLSSTTASPTSTVNYHQHPLPSSVQDALVTNLKKQVTCLELECKFLKEKLASVGDLNGRVVHQSHNGTAAGSVAQSDSLIRRANELEREVLALRNRFAEREQQHQVEVALARKETEVAVFNAIANNTNKKNEAIGGSARYDARDVETMKELHAREVVVLQKRIEHLDFELQYKYEGSTIGGAQDQHGRGHSRDAMAAEIVHFKDLLRKFESDNETLRLQNEALLAEGTSAQSKLSALEGANSGLLREKENLQEQVRGISEGKVVELEKQIKEAHSAEVNKHYEMQQAKAEAEKLRFDLKEAIEARLTSEAAVRRSDSAKTSAESELFAAKGVARDATSQRDKLAADLNNLTVKHAQIEVKVRQLETKGEADRHSVKVLEQQYCATLDELEAARRQARAKDEIYKGLDGTDNQFRTQILLLRKDKDLVKEQLEILQREHQALQDRYAAVEHYAKQQAAEDKLRGALAMMGRTKEDWQSLLQTQMQISNNISSALGDLPDLRAVAESIHFVAPPQSQPLGRPYPSAISHQDPTLYPPPLSIGAGPISDSNTAEFLTDPTNLTSAFNDLSRRANSARASTKASSKVVPIEEDGSAPSDIYPPVRQAAPSNGGPPIVLGSVNTETFGSEVAVGGSTTTTTTTTVTTVLSSKGTATPPVVHEQQPAAPMVMDRIAPTTAIESSSSNTERSPNFNAVQHQPQASGESTSVTFVEPASPRDHLYSAPTNTTTEAESAPTSNSAAFRELAALTDRVTEQESRLAELLANNGGGTTQPE